MSEKWLSTKQMAEVLGIPYTTLRDKVTARAVPHRRVGKHVRFTPEDVAALKEQTFEPVASTTRRRAAA